MATWQELAADDRELAAPPRRSHRDLVRDGRFALQACPQPRKGSDEFYVAGRARRVGDLPTRRTVAAGAGHFVDEAELLRAGGRPGDAHAMGRRGDARHPGDAPSMARLDGVRKGGTR